MRGRHRRPSRTASLITTAATGTAVAGTIAVSALPASASTGVPDAPPAPVSATLAPVRAVADTVRASQPHTYTVRSGDTLSKIAGSQCGNPADWSGIDRANKGKIRDYNLIYPGQVLTLSCKTAIVPVETVVTSVVTPRHVRAVPASSSVRAPVESVSTSGMGAFQACVIRAESGGNSQIWNPSGHWGLYQFSSSTWAAHGGNPADFGRAGAAEQTQIFWNTVHEDGTSDWAPYDGC